MSAFRYAQYCPLARATEILGERWTLLVVRELLLGPKRFSDLRRRLCGVSPSVLSERLAQLEERGVVRQRRLPPPAASRVYELTAKGAALEPVVVELARWGARFLADSRPGDHIEPDWVRLGLATFARRGASPPRSFAITVASPEGEIAFAVCGGRRGTAVRDAAERADVHVRVEAPMALLGLASGALDPRDALRDGTIEASGDLDALREFPRLFDMSTDGVGSEGPAAGR